MINKQCLFDTANQERHSKGVAAHRGIRDPVHVEHLKLHESTGLVCLVTIHHKFQHLWRKLSFVDCDHEITATALKMAVIVVLTQVGVKFEHLQ